VNLSAEDRPHNRFAFFGQINPFKGLDVLLRAMQLLGRGGEDLHLWVHGANLDLFPGPFQEEIKGLLEATRANVTMAGAYRPADLPELMADIDWVVVPSIWWENSPLVIQEAYLHRRPVICSNVGGMAEKVRDGLSGLHFQVRDPQSLARVMRRAAQTPGLWQQLCQGVPAVHDMKDHVANLTALYHRLLHTRSKAGTSTRAA
jgi:glycosyltransferase involved in cell wall biosynthesis